MKEITLQNFEETIREGIVLVDCWASWCGPCRAFAPVYEAVAAKHPDIVFGKIDTEAQPELAGALEVRAIPTVMAFRDGVLLFANPGAMPSRTLEDLIGRVRALDMDAIRKEIAARDAAPAANGNARREAGEPAPS